MKRLLFAFLFFFFTVSITQAQWDKGAWGSYTLNSNVNLGGYYLSGDGDDEGIYINNSGFVGIGTDSPASRLDIVDDAANNGFVIRIENTTDSGEFVEFINDDGDEVMGLRGIAGGSAYFTLGTTGDSDKIRFSSSSTVSNFFNAGNNLGIGTSSPDAQLDVAAEFQLSSATDSHGGYITKTYEATSGTLTGATDTIELAIPSNWLILACHLHVKTAVVDDAGDDTWSSELNDGGTEEVISSGSAAAQDTDVNHFAHADAGHGGTLTDAETGILLTPNGGNFTAGEIEAHCAAFGFDFWDGE